jgi:hypothetical protein
MPTPEEIDAAKEHLRRLEEENNRDLAKKGETNPYDDK